MPTISAQASPALVTASASNQLTTLASTPGLLLPARTAIEDWNNATRLATTDTNWKAWVAATRDLATRWFAVTRDSPSLIAGYPNDYVDVKTGAALNWSIDTPMPTSTATPADVKAAQGWVAINRQYNIQRALDAARLYKLTGDAAMAETAARQLDFYAANYMTWPLRTAIGNARMLGQSLDEAVSTLTMLETAKALQGYASADRINVWRDGLFKPIAANLPTYTDGNLNNINLWCAAAVTAIGLQFNDQTLIDAGTTGAKGINAVLTQGVTLDGIWAEGSFAYNNYVLLALARFFDLAALNGRADMVARYVPDVQRMLLSSIMFRFDDGTLPRPSDTRFAVPPVDTGTHAALYRHVPTSFGVKAAAASRSWNTLLDVPPTPATAPTLPPTQTVNASDTRMLLMRQGTWQLFVHYGQKTANHAQEEALSYELVQGVTSITRDAGTATSYSLPQHLNYFSRGVGNNVPLMDGLGQAQWAAGTVTQFNPSSGAFDVVHPNYRPGISASRSYRLSTSGFGETTRLTVQGTNPAAHRLGVMFNSSCAVTVVDTRAGVAAAAAAPAGGLGFGFWTGVTLQQAQATWVAQLNCAGKNYEMTITGPAGHSVYRAVAPNTPLPATRNAIYLEAVGTDVSFTTSFRALP